jgi:hypothetical protein
MSRTGLVTIERFEVKKSDLDKVKKAFHVKDNRKAIQMAFDAATGKIELEDIFGKYRGTKI